MEYFRPGRLPIRKRDIFNSMWKIPSMRDLTNIEAMWQEKHKMQQEDTLIYPDTTYPTWKFQS